MLAYLTRTSFRNKLAVCASSDGGPDLNFEEHSAGNSTFGTAKYAVNTTLQTAICLFGCSPCL